MLEHKRQIKTYQAKWNQLAREFDREAAADDEPVPMLDQVSPGVPATQIELQAAMLLMDTWGNGCGAGGYVPYTLPSLPCVDEIRRYLDHLGGGDEQEECDYFNSDEYDSDEYELRAALNLWSVYLLDCVKVLGDAVSGDAAFDIFGYSSTPPPNDSSAVAAWTAEVLRKKYERCADVCRYTAETIEGPDWSPWMSETKLIKALGMNRNTYTKQVDRFQGYLQKRDKPAGSDDAYRLDLRCLTAPERRDFIERTAITRQK